MQPNLNLGLVKKIRVPLAPLGEQLRIVAKIDELFSDLDAGVAALERARANLKRYRAAVLKAAVEGKLTEDWRARRHAEAKHPLGKQGGGDDQVKFALSGKRQSRARTTKHREAEKPEHEGLLMSSSRMEMGVYINSRKVRRVVLSVPDRLARFSRQGTFVVVESPSFFCGTLLKEDTSPISRDSWT